MKLLAALGAITALTSFSVAAQERGEDIDRADLPGRVIFERQCAICHGVGVGDDRSPQLPGTAALEERYRGSQPGALELRSNLPAPVLRVFVRRGIGAMPSFRPSELSDSDIEAIADYLAATAALNATE